jgi:hypothetical protein
MTSYQNTIAERAFWPNRTKSARRRCECNPAIGSLLIFALAALILSAPSLAAETLRNLALNRAAYASSAADFINTGHMATDGQMATKWESKAGDPQWIYVDLGALATVHNVRLKWSQGFARAYKIQVSTDPGPSPVTGFVEHWTDVHDTSQANGGMEEIPLAPVKARCVRLVCNKSGTDSGYKLGELEIYGTGGGVPAQRPQAPSPRNAPWELSGGWKLCSQEFVTDEAARVSTCGYDDSQWLVATVPGTVLTSYLNAGAIPDMFYGDQQFQVSDWFCRCSWWYRTEVELPESYRGKRIWLNLEGINHTADIFLNGSQVGKIAGAFIRGRFDITDQVRLGRKNAIAVLVHPMPKPMEPVTKQLDKLVFNDGFTVNTPTFVESAEWDWLPTIRDRNIGIWNRVFLSTSGGVTIVDPFVITELPLLPDTSRADVTVRAELKNSSNQPCSGRLRGTLGQRRFEQRVTIGAGQTRTVSFDQSAHPALSIRKPRLWWPNGYGEPYLHGFSLRFEPDEGGVSDVYTCKIGIRKFTCSTGRPLTFFCNGQKILIKGANWGMEEGMLRCDRRAFDIRLRMEKDMNFTMIRNCLGQVDKEEFFDLCDQYGLLVWEEFGINHAVKPDNVEMWMENAKDRLLVRRNRACIPIWCTANERGPTEPIKSAMPLLVAQLDGTRFYLQHSTLKPPTEGDGPYETQSPPHYFKLARGFRAETGSPTIPPVESMRRIMPHDKLWPVNETWATHDWVNAGKSADCCGLTEKAIAAYGAPTGIEDFCRKAQMVNMETFRAIYEAWNDKLWDDCTGIMIWMSNPCWPSLTWNTYDYYLEPTAAYFGCKRACEPVHVQWNMVSDEVKVVNATLKDLAGVTVEAAVFNLDGSRQLKKSVRLDCPANSVCKALDLFDGKAETKTAAENALSGVYFIRLDLTDRAGRLLSDNFYWQGKSPGAYQDLAALAKVGVSGSVKSTQKGDACKLRATMHNPSQCVALMTRLKLVDTTSGLLVAPIMYSDNYFSLTGGQSKQVAIEFNAKDLAGGEVALLVEGWNVLPAEVARFRIKRF